MIYSLYDTRYRRIVSPWGEKWGSGMLSGSQTGA